MDVDELYAMAGVTPDDIDLVQTYDDYPVISMMQFEDLGFCRKGEGPDFVRQHDLDDRRQRSRTIPPADNFGRAGRRGRRLSRGGRGDARRCSGRPVRPRSKMRGSDWRRASE